VVLFSKRNQCHAFGSADFLSDPDRNGGAAH
jgi:hypothetical protein